MSDRLKIHLPVKIKKQFGKLAEMANCTKSHLASIAISDYIAREEKIIASGKRR